LPVKPGAAPEAAELIAAGPPFDPDEAGFDRHTVYLSERDVVFVFEGPGAEYGVQDLLDDPVRSAALSFWAPLLEGTPKLGHEVYHWRCVRR
jgi:hypothetical protein